MTQHLTTNLDAIVNTERWAISSDVFCAQCRKNLNADGVIVLPDFLTQHAVELLQIEGRTHQSEAFYTQSSHNVYLTSDDTNYPNQHPRNRHVVSSKGCITTDQIPLTSYLHTLYESSVFKSFLCQVLGESELYEYADPLSSINLHYASEGQELGWHFDNSSFAITLLIQKPEGGGIFEYVPNVRTVDKDAWNFTTVSAVLDKQHPVQSLSMDAGCLVLFRGRNALHRVTPTEGTTTRMLAVLAYNAEPGIALSESARMTFYGRTI